MSSIECKQVVLTYVLGLPKAEDLLIFQAEQLLRLLEERPHSKGSYHWCPHSWTGHHIRTFERDIYQHWKLRSKIPTQAASRAPDAVYPSFSPRDRMRETHTQREIWTKLPVQVFLSLAAEVELDVTLAGKQEPGPRSYCIPARILLARLSTDRTSTHNGKSACK